MNKVLVIGVFCLMVVTCICAIAVNDCEEIIEEKEDVNFEDDLDLDLEQRKKEALAAQRYLTGRGEKPWLIR